MTLLGSELAGGGGSLPKTDVSATMLLGSPGNAVAASPQAKQASAERELMRIGHAENAAGDFAAARLNFQAAFELGGGKVEAQLSAANMAYKMGETELACFEYQQILKRADLAAWHRGRVVQKLQTASTTMHRAAEADVPYVSMEWLLKLAQKSSSAMSVAAYTLSAVAAGLGVGDLRPPSVAATAGV